MNKIKWRKLKMKKKIIITSGPTNERIDSVMKITNMSTGALGCVFAETFLEEKEDEIEKIFFISTKMSYKPRIKSQKIEYVIIESTQDLINALKKIFNENKIDIIIHSAAVGDYVGKYSIRAEDIVDEIWETIQNTPTSKITKERLMEIFENPHLIADNSGKMLSYQPHLMTMFTLTPKVIGMIKKLEPNVKLVGFKLLDGVSKENLLEVATKLREKNNADYIVANDLSKIGGGKHWAMIIGEDGIIKESNTKKEIAKEITKLVF